MDGIENVKRYLAMRAEKPMRQLGDGIHTVNAGSEWEGELRLSDLQELMASRDELLVALKDAYEWMWECGAQQAFPLSVEAAAKKYLS